MGTEDRNIRGEDGVIRDAVCAGCVVFDRKRPGEVLVIIGHPDHKTYVSFPKGLAEGEDSLCATAKKETRQETGHHVRVLKFIDQTSYTRKFGDIDTKKTVNWFLATVRHGVPLGEPDKECDDVTWMPIAEALQKLSFEDDKKILEKAVSARFQIHS